MNDLILSFMSAVLMGLGATLTFDLWGLFLKRVFNIPSSNICLVGRWLGYVPEGIFQHTNIGSAPIKRGECMLGWIAHYSIGMSFAIAFVVFAGSGWLRHPTPIPAILFGVATVLAPFLILQPLFGYGLAASKTSNPRQARLRSLMNHTAFGVGLYLFAWLANGFFI